MTDPPARVRRPVAADSPPTDPSIRRIYWYAGAALGILAGALIALFAIPPLFDRYFDTADIALGDTFERDGLALRIDEVLPIPPEAPARYEVRLALASSGGWCPTPSDFRLELTGGVSLAPVAFAPPLACEDGAGIPPGTLTIAFNATGHGPDDPHILHLDDPKVRFHLYLGEPE